MRLSNFLTTSQNVRIAADQANNGCFDLLLTFCSNVAILLWPKNDLLVKFVLFAEKMNLVTFKKIKFFSRKIILSMNYTTNKKYVRGSI